MLQGSETKFGRGKGEPSLDCSHAGHIQGDVHNLIRRCTKYTINGSKSRSRSLPGDIDTSVHKSQGTEASLQGCPEGQPRPSESRSLNWCISLRPTGGPISCHDMPCRRPAVDLRLTHKFQAAEHAILVRSVVIRDKSSSLS